jgi:hypothetical protein
MNRIKLTAISTLSAAMILGSAVVFAAAPADDAGTAEISAEQPSVQADQLIKPSRRGGGGAGMNLKK